MKQCYDRNRSCGSIRAHQHQSAQAVHNSESHTLPIVSLALQLLRMLALKTGLLCCALHGATALAASTSDLPSPPESEKAPQIIASSANAADLKAFLEISPELRSILDSKIATIHSKSARVVALHELFYNPKFFGIHYDNSFTKTAQQALDTRAGNCLSLSALFVSAARYVNLNAHFQQVQLPAQWDDNPNFNVYLAHVNVLVMIPGGNATVEFLDTYTAAQTSKFASRKISDNEALARYYSNRGAELLGHKQVELALPLLRLAVDTYPKLADVWVNLGVAYKMRKDDQMAEDAYLKAQKIDPKNLSASTNLFALYSERGESHKADLLATKIRQHQLKNPYYQIKLGEDQMAAQDYAQALAHFNKAIKIQPEMADFYKRQAEAYTKLGRSQQSAEALEKSLAVARKPADRAQTSSGTGGILAKF